MEKGKIYVFYKNKNYDVGIGEYFGKYESCFVFKNKDEYFMTEDVYDELNPNNDVNNFIEYIAEKFQNKFQKNVSVWQEDYEFKISIPREYAEDYISLDAIEELMDNALEDWWSVVWLELKYNKIECKRNSIEVSFRVHNIHEIQFRYNEEVK